MTLPALAFAASVGFTAPPTAMMPMRQLSTRADARMMFGGGGGDNEGGGFMCAAGKKKQNRAHGTAPHT